MCNLPQGKGQLGETKAVNPDLSSSSSCCSTLVDILGRLVEETCVKSSGGRAPAMDVLVLAGG
jgi:hypothetical protein